MVSRRPDQTRTGASVTLQGTHCGYRAPNRLRRPEPFHEDVSPCHGRNTQRLAAKSQTLTSGRTAPHAVQEPRKSFQLIQGTSLNQDNRLTRTVVLAVEIDVARIFAKSSV